MLHDVRFLTPYILNITNKMTILQKYKYFTKITNTNYNANQ